MKKLARFMLLGLGQCAAACCGAVALAWLIGCAMGDRFVWSQWLSWMPTPAALAAIVAGTLLSFRPTWRAEVRRRWRVGAWSALLCAVLVSFGCFENRVLSRPPDAPAGVSVMHWTLTEPLADDPTRFTSTIRDSMPDVAVVTNAGWSVVKREAQSLVKDDGYAIHRRWPFTIVTRLPVVVRQALLAADEHTINIALLVFDATETTFGRDLSVWVVDLPSDPDIGRYEMARRVRTMLDELQTPTPDLIVGDLNMLRDSPAVRTMFPEFEHAFDLAGHGLAGTFPRRRPWWHIDHILLQTKHLMCSRYDIIDPGVGRHCAHMAWIAPALN